MAEPSFAFGPQWQGRCFVCGAIEQQYRTDKRLCQHCKERYRHERFFRDVSDLGSCFATILPQTDAVAEGLLRHGFSDMFLKAGEGDKRPGRLLKRAFPAGMPLPCGQPVLLELKHMAQFAGLGGTWVLDLSPYIWSGTLKDLRSWAVLSLAIEHRINHLALWTAGNAGYSLAKLVHRWNATVPTAQRKTVYSLVDAFASPEMVVTLRSLQCRVAPISTGSGTILSRDQLYHVVASIAGERKDYWQVTDGWDGVGVFMYSLLARQCFHFLRTELSKIRKLEGADVYIILPLGTGNLLLGFIRGMEHVGEGRAKVVAALPYGDHMMKSFEPPDAEPNDRPRMRRDLPEAPKLTGFYSPLSPCLWHLLQDRDFSHVGAVEFIEVDRAAQIEAAARVLGPAETMTVAAEPSALIAFGALKQLAQRIRDHDLNLEHSVALVVNSGFGIMGMKEQEFFTKSIFAFR
ncbi:MAG: hypothetical protein G01um101438_224 [Parcubacteria group bacterium Gr01-1014_38]|nr:MAG: hypothetical protein G01um101438_224 [Parcubacteria group bacterium Gr01-1014_38]